MDDFENSPLDILDDDGDDAVEMNVFFDDEGKKNQGGKKPDGKSGCCVPLFLIGTSVTGATIIISRLII